MADAIAITLHQLPQSLGERAAKAFDMYKPPSVTRAEKHNCPKPSCVPPKGRASVCPRRGALEKKGGQKRKDPNMPPRGERHGSPAPNLPRRFRE